ncbi:MAG TPA: hypothetical protein VGF58_06570 [Burkholderiales bacterium]|jgi:hypothetical protein
MKPGSDPFDRRRFLQALGPVVIAFGAPGLAATAEQASRRFPRPGERLLFYLRAQGLARRHEK